MPGTVDSGATQTALSIEHAERLGLASTDLIDADPVILAGGLQIPSWTAPVQSVDRSKTSPLLKLLWNHGGRSSNSTDIARASDPHLGQSDFWNSFEVILQRYLDPARFVLDHWNNMSSGKGRGY